MSVLASQQGREWAADAERLKAAYERLRLEHHNPLRNRAESLAVLQGLAIQSERMDQRLAHLREQICVRLAQSNLHALGFEGRGIHAPERLAPVMPEIWTNILRGKGRIDWEESAVDDMVRSFRAVRIVTGAMLGPVHPSVSPEDG